MLGLAREDRDGRIDSIAIASGTPGMCSIALTLAGRAAKPKFPERDQAACAVQDLTAKIFAFLFFRNLPFSRRPTSARGAYRDRHDTRGGMRWTRMCRRRATQLRTAKSCGPGAPMQAPSSRQCGLRIALMTVATSWFTGESSKQAVKPLRREGFCGKNSIKSMPRQACVRRCVAIRQSHDLSVNILRYTGQ